MNDTNAPRVPYVPSINLQTATHQEVFEFVWRFLIAQGERSIGVSPSPASSQPRCQYRGESSRMCAVGCLIPDEEYSEAMETRSVSGLIKNGSLSKDKWGRFGDMLGILQGSHDEPMTWRNVPASVVLSAEQCKRLYSLELSTAFLEEMAGSHTQTTEMTS